MPSCAACSAATGGRPISRDFSLYVHVPFCTRTCPYCDFYQVPWRDGREAGFVEAVLAEARLARDELALEDATAATVYWGGGTPSLLTPDAVGRLAEGLADCFRIARDAEFTVEANPAEAAPATLRALRGAGANRLSLGCQSFQPERLAFLGRWHAPADNTRAVAAARDAGFDDVTLDLIFGLPADLGAEGWRADVRAALALGPEHLSLYGLTIEPRTAFGRRAVRGELRAAEPDAYAEEYLWAAAELAAAGYRRYETSSFARRGRESRHNRRYWTGARYLGLGPAAHSHWDGRRWANARSLERWRAAVLAGRPERELDETLEADELRVETIYLGLRSGAGLDPAQLRAAPGAVQRFTADLREAGLAQAEGRRVVLTDAGHLLLDEIAARLLALEGRGAETVPHVSAGCPPISP